VESGLAQCAPLVRAFQDLSVEADEDVKTFVCCGLEEVQVESSPPVF
jgi:hypothetical protein